MADVLLSSAAERIISLIEEQAQLHVNLVRGAEKEVRRLSKELNTVRNVLDDAENRRSKDKNINAWLWKLRRTSYEMEDILDEWKYAILKLQKGENNAAPSNQKVCSFIPSSSCFCFKKVVVRHEIAKKMLNVKAELDEILEEKKRYSFRISETMADPSSPESRRDQSTSLIDLGEVHGRDREGDILVSKLMANGELGIQVVSIVGVGGLGKTTLAQLVYNHSQVEASFDFKIWICVSDPFDPTVIAKSILESIREGSSRNADQLNVLFRRVRESILGKKFLIVLDDVWTEDYKKWEPLENLFGSGGAGSKILVTTRSRRVAVTIGTRDSEIFQLGVLSDEDCWSILCCMARLEGNTVEFEDIGKKIAQKCSGLPLTAKTLGSLLRFKSSLGEWENVLNSEIWGMQEVEDELFPPLLMSYRELSPIQKQCFSYCAVFPKDSVIYVKKLIEIWTALGYLGSDSGDMELKGKECFDVLAMRSLFQDFRKYPCSDEIEFCKMHDIIHDFAQFIRKSGRVGAAERNKTTCGACNPLLVSNVDEFCSLYCKRGSPPNLCSCLLRLRVLSLANFGFQGVPRGIDNLIHLRWLDLCRNKLSTEDLIIIFQLYYLQTLNLSHCNLEEIPKEIENLFDLRHLDLSYNALEKLSSELWNLKQLRHLNLWGNTSLKDLPMEIGKLVLLQTFRLPYWGTQCQIPEALAQLTSLQTLSGFKGGSGCSKLGLLKNLNQLVDVSLYIRLDGKDLKDMVEDARVAEFSNKMHIQNLELVFEDEMDKEEESSRMDVIDALTPHPNLRKLYISGYKGSKLPRWIVSLPNQLRKVDLYHCHLTSLPSLGKLPCLEEIYIDGINVLEFVGREFLGITTNTNFVAFPKLKTLTIQNCPKWKEWEDIMPDEEEESSAIVLVMPCLTELNIKKCNGMTLLPHRLLRKTSSLQKLDLYGSEKLEQRYGNKDGSDWKSISINNPSLQLRVQMAED